jgi:hypothetical protein
MLDSHRRSPIERGDTSINRAVAYLVDIRAQEKLTCRAGPLQKPSDQVAVHDGDL